MTTTAIPQTGQTTFVCQLGELPVGEVITVRLPEYTAISVFHTEEGLFAIDDTCTHQDSSLADGWVEDCKVECPLHDSCFDLRTGAASGPPAKVPVRTYGIYVADGAVWLQLPSSP